MVALVRAPALGAMILLVGCGGRTAIDEGPDLADAGPEEVFEAQCGDPERFTQPGRPIALKVGLEGPASVIRSEWRMVARPDDSTAEIEPTTGTVTGLAPDVVGLYQLEFEAEDAEGAQVECSYDVVSTLDPPVLQCPEEPPSGPLGSPLTLVAPGDRVFTWQWRIVDTPPGATATIEPSDARTVQLTGDREGPYRLEVTGYGVDGASDTCEMTVLLTGAPEVTCPPEEIEAPTRRPTTLSAEATDDTGIASVRWEVIERPADSTAEPDPSNRSSTTFTPDRAGRYVLEFTATDVDGFEASCEVRVRATPTAPDALCPSAVVTEPLERVELTGSGVDDGTVVAYRWEVTRRPPGSAARPPSPPDERTTTFRPDVAGEYVLRLTVTDDDGETGICDVSVTAVSTQGLRVEIFWNGPPDESCGVPRTPGCDGSDVDVHLLRPGNETWFDPNGDCYWDNCNAMQGYRLNWGGPGRDDDPRLDIDDVEGFGPENINIDEPVPGTYRVGVDFWDGDNRTSADVVVNIYCGEESSEPEATFGPETLLDRQPGPARQEDNDFWRVADVEIREGGPCTVHDLSLSDGSPNIITHGAAEHTR